MPGVEAELDTLEKGARHKIIALRKVEAFEVYSNCNSSAESLEFMTHLYDGNSLKDQTQSSLGQTYRPTFSGYRISKSPF